MAARRAVGAATAVAAAVSLALACTAAAQSIVIPDFRQPPPAVVNVPAGQCKECGRIVSIREVPVERRTNRPAQFQSDRIPSGGPVDRPLVGAVMYLPLGQGSDAAYIGGVGTAEMKERFSDASFEITVQLDDGSVRFLQRSDANRYRVGDRVRLSGAGGIELVAGT